MGVTGFSWTAGDVYFELFVATDVIIGSLNLHMALPTVRFKHARFSARFPETYRYSKSHYWMAPVEGQEGVWRVGFTKFATRMLGELVDCDWKVPAGGPVEPGQIVGWVEGFKAASDVYCVMQGSFVEGNPYLKQDA